MFPCYLHIWYTVKYSIPVESIIFPVADVMEPSVIPINDGMLNVKRNCSVGSRSLSAITGTLTLLILIPLANVAVSGAVLKSTSPVSQKLFSQHIMIHTMLPSADTGDCSDGVTVTLNGLADVPPVNSTSTLTKPDASVPE